MRSKLLPSWRRTGRLLPARCVVRIKPDSARLVVYIPVQWSPYLWCHVQIWHWAHACTGSCPVSKNQTATGHCIPIWFAPPFLAPTPQPPHTHTTTPP